MAAQERRRNRFSQSLTFKALTILTLTLLLLIPKAMITGLIEERQYRSRETVREINKKWSDPQTICGPVLTVPYYAKVVEDEIIDNKIHKKVSYESRKLSLMPNVLNINVKLFPENKYYGIYKATPYKSEVQISGDFSNFNKLEENYHLDDIDLDDVYILIGIYDLKGLVSNAEFTFNDNIYFAESEGHTDWFSGNTLKIPLKDFTKTENGENKFYCNLTLNGSEAIDFVPVGRTTEVTVSGEWSSPSFIGNFSPESTIENGNFSAKWHILHFNRDIPEILSNNYHCLYYDNNYSFGVQLIETVDHYQQNMRSAKYALMFIVLTFVAFFFVEALTKKKIHIIQYLLVGVALIIFYSLLLSISEQIGFALAYLIAGIATIGLIAFYAYSVFKNKTQTSILTLILCMLYTFLYVILQLENLSLLIGSIGLFVILGIIMYVSRKISWYKDDKREE